MIRDKIIKIVKSALFATVEKGELTGIGADEINALAVEKTRNAQFGDYAVNVSPLARCAKLPPVKIAEAVVANVETDEFDVSVAAGFVNFTARYFTLNGALAEIIRKGTDFAKNNSGNGQKVLLEYVSANPTGPLHIGHGRWAAVGSALANLMKFSGYSVDQEFYINDAGNQINNLGRSLWIRVLQELGIDAKFPETEEEGSKNYYAGEYLVPLAQDYVKQHEAKARELQNKNPEPLKPSAEVVKEMSDFAKAIMLEQQKQLLAKFNTNFECWYSETALHESGKVKAAIETLKGKGELEEKEDAVWFKSSKYGDDQDRVIIKSDGSYTYLTADIAYHYDKLQRGYEKLINIWGADHHGYVPRMKASLQALGYSSEALEVLLGQLVNLIISGEQVRMGKRRKMLTLEELIDEVGVDATRYWMIMRSIDTTLDFDVDLAKSCSDENPVYYAQYAHARASSILRNATSERHDHDTKEVLPPYITKAELESLVTPESFTVQTFESLWVDDEKEAKAARALAVKLESFEDAVAIATAQRAPYQIARYIQELAGDFHYFYTFSRVLTSDESVMKARLSLVCATRQVFQNALGLLGVTAPESM